MASARDYLGIQLAGEEARVVAVRVSSGGAHVLGSARLSRAEASQSRSFRRLGARPLGSATALPLDQAAIRNLTLPPTTPENLDRIIHLQAEQVLPLAAEDLCLGYHILGMNDQSRLEVLLVAARQGFVQDALGQASPPGAPPAATVDPVCVFNALVYDGEFGKEEEIAVALLEPGRAELLLVHQGRLTAARPLAIALPKAFGTGDSPSLDLLAGEIRLSLAGGSQQTGGRIAQLLLCGAAAPSVAEALAQHLDLPVRLWAPRGLLAAGLSLPEATAFVPAYGAALQAGGRGPMTINLTPAGLAAARTQARTRQAAFSWVTLAVSLVLALLMVVGASVLAREREVRQLQAETRRWRAAGSITRVSESAAKSYGNALNAARQATLAPLSPSKMLAILNQELPQGVWLVELTYHRRTGARLRGYALERSGPQAALVALLQRNLFAEVTLNYFKEETYEDTPVWAFEFTCRTPDVEGLQR